MREDWDAIAIGHLRELWDQGATVYAIAAKLQYDYNEVKREIEYLQRFRLLLPRKEKVDV